jgi:hypothetical protein
MIAMRDDTYDRIRRAAREIAALAGRIRGGRMSDAELTRAADDIIKLASPLEALANEAQETYRREKRRVSGED